MKTERDQIAWQVDSESAGKYIFEGVVEQQELVQGGLEPPQGESLSTTPRKHRVVTVRVLRTYRGPKQEQFTILTGSEIDDCGFDFATGRKYLVFADERDDGALFTSMCMLTQGLDLASPALLRYLRGEPAAHEDFLSPRKYYAKFSMSRIGMVCGNLLDPDGKPPGEAQVSLFLLRDDPLSFHSLSTTVSSDSKGKYCFKYVLPGTYTLGATVSIFRRGDPMMGYYPGVYEHSAAARIEITAGARLNLAPFKLHRENLYSIRVRVVTPEGDPAPPGGISLEIEPAEQDGLPGWSTTCLNSHGKHTFESVPARKYVVTYVFTPEPDAEQYAKNLTHWLRLGEQTVEVKGNTEVILKLIPKK
jgi:hypothetical protein